MHQHHKSTGTAGASGIDFNTAGPQSDRGHQANRIDADDVRQAITGRAREFVEWMFPGTIVVHKSGRYAVIGDIYGQPGESLEIELTGQKAGYWNDHASAPDRGRDLLSLFMASNNFGAADFPKALLIIDTEFLGHTRPEHKRKSFTVKFTKRANQHNDKPRPNINDRPAPAESYVYRDEDGGIIAVVRRHVYETIDPKTGKSKKTFSVWDARNSKPQAPTPRQLYRLDQIKDCDKLVFVEGERKADALSNIGIEATCIMFGSNAKFEEVDWTPIAGKRIVVWPDKDKAGWAFGERLAAHLAGLGCDVSIITPPDDKPGKWDAADCVAEGSDPKALIAAAVHYDGKSNTAHKFLTLDQWRQRDLPPPDFLMAEVFSTTSRTLLAAATGLGKTNVALAIGMRMAAGAKFLHWQGYRKCKVLYVDGEMSRRLLKQRLEDEEKRLADEVSPRLNTFKPDRFYALSTADIENFAPLNTPEGLRIIEQIITDIGGVDFVIFDNVMSLIAGKMVDEEAWAQTMPWVQSLTKRNIGQLWIHHTNDQNQIFGTKTRAWQMDGLIVLTKVERPDADISFELDFTKARERTPENRDDYQKIAIFLKDGRWQCDKPIAKKGKVRPQALKFYQALVNVAGGGDLPKSKRLHGRHAVHNDDWWAECELLGLIDPKEKPNSARALFSKNRRELIVADKIACQGEHSWLL